MSAPTLPLLVYLTVFRSRLGLVNQVLSQTSFGHQPEASLLRKIRNWLEAQTLVSVEDPGSELLFSYLREKKLLSGQQRERGRYKGYALKRESGRWQATRNGEPATQLPVYVVDVLMSDPSLRSTVGTPTPDNVQEILDLVFQLRLLSKGKTTWTAAAHTMQTLRGWNDEDTKVENPFLLAGEQVALLRQILEVDGIMLREVVRELALWNGTRVSRDDITRRFEQIVDRVREVSASLPLSAPEVREIREFSSLIHETAAKRAKMSQAPGVLEHRVTARLEWLTDLGYLSKAGPRNAFTYEVSRDIHRLLAEMDSAFGESNWADAVSIREWRHQSEWSPIREGMPALPMPECFLRSYTALRRRIGPSPVREVAFVAALLSEELLSFSDALDALLDFARATEGVSLSGGRFSKSPENIFIADSALREDR
jgi:hypothetical protein